ncbi:MAG: hypothetical protein QM757_00790 [Paludibaculum sp.]
MSNHCEAIAGAPPMPGSSAPARAPSPAGAPNGPGSRPQMTPEQIAERKAAMEKIAEWREIHLDRPPGRQWRRSSATPESTSHLLCYNMQDSMKDDDIVYGFEMAKALGVKGITTSTTLTMAKRIAPIADKYKIPGRLSRPRRHQRPQSDGNAGKLRRP